MEISNKEALSENEKAQTSLSVELNRAIREDRLVKQDETGLYLLPLQGGDATEKKNSNEPPTKNSDGDNIEL